MKSQPYLESWFHLWKSYFKGKIYELRLKSYKNKGPNHSGKHEQWFGYRNLKKQGSFSYPLTTQSHMLGGWEWGKLFKQQWKNRRFHLLSCPFCSLPDHVAASPHRFHSLGNKLTWVTMDCCVEEYTGKIHSCKHLPLIDHVIHPLSRMYFPWWHRFTQRF